MDLGDRTIPPWTGEERSMLVGWLDFHRDTLEAKCGGLDHARLRVAAAAPSALTLLGLVRHMAEVERNWFRRTLAGEDVPMLFRGAHAHGGDHPEFDVSDPDGGFDEARRLWRAEIGEGRHILAAAGLDDEVALRDSGPLSGTRVSVRWVLIHLIEEYARHNGHADLLRERIDGTTGP